MEISIEKENKIMRVLAKTRLEMKSADSIKIIDEKRMK